MEIREETDFARVNECRLLELAGQWANEEFILPDWRLPVLPEKDDDDFIQFLGISSAINFCYTDPETKEKFSTQYKGKTRQGAMAMSACLMRAIDEGAPLLQANFLKNLTLEAACLILRGNVIIPLLYERWQFLREVGRVLELHFQGSFAKLFKEAGFYAFAHGFLCGCPKSGIIELLKNFQCFSDVGFDKRCRLLTVLYHGRAMSSKGALPPIHDIFKVDPIADYQIAHSLSDLGVLEYNSYLRSKIISQIYLKARGPEETAIRRCSVEAIKWLMTEINRRRPRYEKINICHLDYKLWTAGRNSQTPHHLCMTTNY